MGTLEVQSTIIGGNIVVQLTIIEGMRLTLEVQLMITSEGKCMILKVKPSTSSKTLSTLAVRTPPGKPIVGKSITVSEGKFTMGTLEVLLQQS